MKSFNSCDYRWLGPCTYSEALAAQSQWYSESPPVSFLGFETLHPTITLGLSASAETELLHPPASFEIVKTDRGGQATLHSPGQLVMFPVLNLKSLQIRPKEIVCALLQTLKKPLERLWELDVQVRDNGLYTPQGKMGFVGLRIRDKQVMHGLSLNVSNDLEEFSAIHSCGVRGATHDRLLNYHRNIQPKQVFEAIFSR